MATWSPTWSGRWIWANAGSPPVAVSASGQRMVHLRRVLSLEAVPDTVPTRVTADSRYVLWVNGREVSRGPARNVPERMAFHELDLAAHLRPGTNVVAALVRFYGSANRWWRPARPYGDLGHGSFLLEAPDIDLRSDSTWRGRTAGWASDVAGGDPVREVIDGRAAPHGWLFQSYDDTAWAPALELAFPVVGSMSPAPPGPPYSGMESSGIAEQTAHLRVPEIVASGRLTTASHDQDPVAAYGERSQTSTPHAVDAPSFVTFDVGEITHGTVGFVLDAAAGTILDLYAGEDLADDGRAVIAPRNWTARYVCAGIDGEAGETFDPVGLRYLTAVLRGPGELASAHVVERRYPTIDPGEFTCSDPVLNRIWAAGARTVELCATDAFVDCPGREQQAWVGDSYLHTLVALVSNGDWRLVRRNLRMGAHSQRGDGFLSAIAAGGASLGSLNIPEYSSHWIRALCRYVERSGDRATARELLPTASEVVRAFERYRREDGFLRGLPGVVFVDWAQTERATVTAAVDALHAAALLDYARLLELVVDDAEGAAEARALHSATARAFARLWDERRGVYVDALDERGPRRRVSQQTNALAIVGRCAPPDRWGRMLDTVLDPGRVKRTLSNADLPEEQHWQYQAWAPIEFDERENVVEAQPFLAHFLHQAVAAAGSGADIADRCRLWWPQLEAGATTFQEFWDGLPGRASRCHGWSATPTYDLTTHVLGLRPLLDSREDVGFLRALVTPALGSLQAASGRVPTPHGGLSVEVTPGEVVVEVPAGMLAVTVRLPGREDHIVGPGRHRIT